MGEHVHFLGICGYAVHGAALLAKELGYTVSGSDDLAYPPISTVITDAGIPWVNSYAPGNLERFGHPDLVVVGNNVRPGNVEWEAVQQAAIPTTSEIEFFLRLIGSRERVAVLGTHGKTTTSSALAVMLEHAGLDPGFRIGGIVRDFDAATRLGSGPFVFEGDEYTTAVWDRRPKFAHIHPRVAGIVNLEWDHPDIYPSFDAYLEPFFAMAAAMPPDGLLVVNGDDPSAVAVGSAASCRIQQFGRGDDADWRISHEASSGLSQEWDLTHAPDGTLTHFVLPRPGSHDAGNITLAAVLAHAMGVPMPESAEAVRSFRGPGRRFEPLTGDCSVTVIDDYAHHPSEVLAVLEAARRAFPAHRIIGIHTPHTYTRTRALLGAYATCCRAADIMVLGPIDAARERGSEQIVSDDEVRSAIHGPDVIMARDVDDAEATVRALLKPGDVVVVLSLSGFDKIADRIASHVREAFPAVRQ